ncbi:MAG: hypothetical protein P1V18_00145 [Candidatus Gracilibacteria bacterium]|nr:hypothetical protein [Candidatus Gracilibacteria bacterium]
MSTPSSNPSSGGKPKFGTPGWLDHINSSLSTMTKQLKTQPSSHLPSRSTPRSTTAEMRSHLSGIFNK